MDFNYVIHADCGELFIFPRGGYRGAVMRAKKRTRTGKKTEQAAKREGNDLDGSAKSNGLPHSI